MGNLVCSFFGHRKIVLTDNLKQKVKDCIESLIAKYNVEKFLFGSKSNFNDFCHLALTELKEKYTNVKRVCYTCKSEGCLLESKRQEYESFYLHFMNKEEYLPGFEEEFEHKTKYEAGRASYVERNQAMIDDSDFCVFYYDKNYTPLTQTNSGTKIAYLYAIKKKKIVINLFD